MKYCLVLLIGYILYIGGYLPILLHWDKSALLDRCCWIMNQIVLQDMDGWLGYVSIASHFCRPDILISSVRNKKHLSDGHNRLWDCFLVARQTGLKHTSTSVFRSRPRSPMQSNPNRARLHPVRTVLTSVTQHQICFIFIEYNMH